MLSEIKHNYYIYVNNAYIYVHYFYITHNYNYAVLLSDMQVSTPTFSFSS